MIRIYLTPDGSELQNPADEIGACHSVARAHDIGIAAYTMHDSAMGGYIQTVSDVTGYVYDEWRLYKYDAPVDIVDAH